MSGPFSCERINLYRLSKLCGICTVLHKKHTHAHTRATNLSDGDGNGSSNKQHLTSHARVRTNCEKRVGKNEQGPQKSTGNTSGARLGKKTLWNAMAPCRQMQSTTARPHSGVHSTCSPRRRDAAPAKQKMPRDQNVGINTSIRRAGYELTQFLMVSAPPLRAAVCTLIPG